MPPLGALGAHPSGCFVAPPPQDLQSLPWVATGSHRLFAAKNFPRPHVSKGRPLGSASSRSTPKWNAADITPATLRLGCKTVLSGDLTVGNLALRGSTSRGFAAPWKEPDKACIVIPEASIDALKEQLANAQLEKEQLIKQHQEELSAQKTSYQELKSQLIQLGLDHAKVLEAAEAEAAAKMNEALEEASNSTVVLQAELEELAKARKAAEEKVARLEEEHKECNQLILQTDALAHRLFPDSQTHAVKKVNARRTTQGQANLAVPWTPHDHLVALNARVSHMRAIDRNLLSPQGRLRIRECAVSAAPAPGALVLCRSFCTELDSGMPHRMAKARKSTDPILAAQRQIATHAEYAECDLHSSLTAQDYLDEEEDESRGGASG
ncbi:hypothetical protein QYE76_020544 [Lolium multiflorum]|uniref:Uncharacterized protein n=1 Tax=Lolium multiflorum TaxID=4521 RepID=A0AAD8R782_LOLMU|nr:hypothetical protein QYE76_020544 [Lolium multiflorum]